MRKLITMIALIAILAVAGTASAAKPGAPAPNKGGNVPKGAFNQLKEQVRKQNARIKSLEAKAAWYDNCAQYILDVGTVLDYYVAPTFVIAGYEWTPLDSTGLYALAIQPECVEVETTAVHGTQSTTKPGVGFLERIR
jgi:hypothetical protein